MQSNILSDLSVTDSDSTSDSDCWDDIDDVCDRFSDSSDESEELTDSSFSDKLRMWAVENNVTHK